MKLPSLKTKPLPKAIPLRKLIGPSFILLGLGLGSGEVILWPFLASNYGMGIIWGAIIGITLQFFMNMEIERYALARGESIFVGFARKFRKIPAWFLLSTFAPWMWPGIAAASATIFAHIFNLDDAYVKYLAIAFLISMGLLLSLGPIVYKTNEYFQKFRIAIGVPAVFLITFILATRADWTAAAKGVVGIGDGFFLLPAGISIASFLAALAYAGAGGNLNLAQSFYIKEKGLGMGLYSGRLTSLITGKKHRRADKKPLLTGTKFNANKENVKEFKKWWRNINIEHFVVFWLTGSVSIILLSLLAYITTYGADGTTSDINFVIQEGLEIGNLIAPFVGTFFLLIVGSSLYATQLAVYDATSRIITENTMLLANGKIKEKHIPHMFYFFLWLMIATGVVVFLAGYTQPLQLLLLSAILNAIAMFVHSGLTLWLNKTTLPKSIGPNKFRTGMMIFAFLFYGGFSIYVVIYEVSKFLS